MIDDLDLAILEQLQDDGRRSLRRIAAQVGVAPATVRTRFQQLIADEVIEIVAVPNPARLHIGFHAVVFLRHQAGATQAVSDLLVSHRETAWVGVFVTGCETMCEVVAADANDFLRYREEVLSALPGITQIDVALLTDVLKMRYRLGRSSEISHNDAVVTRQTSSSGQQWHQPESLPDELDLSILEQLEGDGRRSFADIGGSLGVATATVRSRIQRLITDDMVQIVAVPDPWKVGLGFIATVALWVEDGCEAEAARLLCEREEVCWVGVTVSTCDVICTVWLRDTEEYQRYRDDVLTKLPGFRDVKLFVTARIPKVHYHLPTVIPRISSAP